MAHSVKPEIRCSACKKPADLETTKNDAQGNIVDEECYALIRAIKSGT
jgi:hypothetical protein